VLGFTCSGRLPIAALSLTAVTFALTGCGSSTVSSTPDETSGEVTTGAVATVALLPAPPEPAFHVPTPVRLDASEHVSFWAPVVRAVEARAGPDAKARVVEELTVRTPEDTPNIVLVLERRKRAATVWVRVRLPSLPGNETGWIPRTALGGYGVVRTHLIVDVRQLTATLLRNGRLVFRAPIGVGKTQWPTPTGEFYIRNRLTSYSGDFYGPVAFGTSARSAVLTDWPEGGFIGIHGTSRPELLPGRISHGCIRMRNEDILRLSRLMPVGTPLTIL
jgi:hypothetical protein